MSSSADPRHLAGRQTAALLVALILLTVTGATASSPVLGLSANVPAQLPGSGAPVSSIPPPYENRETTPASLVSLEVTNSAKVALSNQNETSLSGLLPLSLVANASTNSDTPHKTLDETALKTLRERLELARHMRTIRHFEEATSILVELLAVTTPDSLQQVALLELGAIAQDENKLSRAQQVYAQFIQRWPNDLRIPEVHLRQGEIFRQMGLNNLALTKFYAVMTSALVLKNDQFSYYANLVSRAQTEIAETHYQLGKYADASEFLTRLLKQDNPALNRPLLLYKLVRAELAMGRHDDAVAAALDYLGRYNNAPERPEVQFCLASSLKQLGRNNEALQQVLALLSEQRSKANTQPEVWAYWQQRTGNVIANQLYHEGDYTKALDIYLNLEKLDSSPQWQLPVSYQIGMTYERLLQPKKATETYTFILSREKEFPTNAPPSLQAVFDMARWRVNFIEWQEKADASNRALRSSLSVAPPPPQPLASLPMPTPAVP